MRMAMMDQADTFEARVTMQPHQGKLDFGDELGADTDGDRAVDQWGQATQDAAAKAGAGKPAGAGKKKAPRAAKAKPSGGAGRATKRKAPARKKAPAPKGGAAEAGGPRLLT